MPQHDWNIANQLFPPTRADLNNALLAAATNSSGTTAPAVPLASQWWADTTNGVMKFRNTANDAWIELFSLTNGEIIQPVTVEAVPIGTIVPWPGLLAPARWSLLDGGVLNRLDYPGLFNVLGTRFNTGGETAAQFRKPDGRGRTFVGRDNMGGVAAGRVTSGTSGVDGLTIGASGGSQALQQHAHPGATPTLSLTLPTVNQNFTGDMVRLGPGGTPHTPAYAGGSSWTLSYQGYSVSLSGGGVSVADPGTTGSQGVGGGQNMQPSMVMNWIIYTGEIGSEGDGGGGTPEAGLGILEARQIACTDETTAISATGVKITLRWPYAFLLTDTRITLNSASATGTFTVTATVNGAAMYSTAITIDATEKTSKTAAVPAVLGLTDIPDDAEVVITVSNVAAGTATGLKFIAYGYRVT
jgi:microcystin-dependent protein